MPTYVALMKLTDQGAKDIKNAPKRAQEFIKGLEAMGGRLIGFYLVMGEYDYVGIAEAPSDEVALTFLMGLGAAGNAKTTTLKAFKLEEFASLVNKLP
ncbi:MAG: GYD domain-containing protein [Acidobacteriaceae bacterium]